MYIYKPVKVPDVQGKLTFRKCGSYTYVNLELERVYNPDKHYNVPKRTVIGRLVDEKDRSVMYPNENFKKYFPAVPVASLENPRVRSNTLKAGPYLAISKIVEEYKLDSLLKKSFDDRAGLILDLASFMIITEDNAAQYYPDYAREHPLFTSNMRVLSDSTISRCLSEISEDQIHDFLDDWNDRQDHRQRIYISYDSTNKNVQAGDLNFAEFGHAKDDKGVPIFNLSLAFDKTNRLPLFYEQYPGSINDVSQLTYLIDKVQAYGYRSIGLILDRGYFSKKNIEYMDAKKMSFLMMVKGCKALVSEMILQHRGTFEEDYSCKVQGTSVNAVTIKRKLYDGDSRERYFHLCYSPWKMAEERGKFEFELSEMERSLKLREGREITIEEPQITKYFDCLYDSRNGRKIFLGAQPKVEAITKEIQLCGYFCLISSDQMTADEAYHLYRGRDVSEKLFRADKSFLGAKSMRVHTSEAAAAKLFIEFIALIIRNRFYNLLKDEMRRLKCRKNFLTVPAAVKELEKLEITRRRGSVYMMDFALTKNQKTILRCFGLSPDDAVLGTQKIAALLEKQNDELPAEAEEEESIEDEQN